MFKDYSFWNNDPEEKEKERKKKLEYANILNQQIEEQ